MSGIAGIIHFDSAPVEPGQIEKMTAAMAHRGPDGIQHWVRGNVALGQCMLRTTPESLQEIQPLTNEDDSLVLVMDGRVDNWEELRRELLGRGATLRTRADAELVLRAYEIGGKDCLAHIDGDFALVIWDARQKQAFCSRDRMGNKPFHYHWDGKTLAFASELHPILTLPWVKAVPNEGIVAEFLAWDFFSRDETFWRGIMRLVAAHRMVVGAGGPRPEQYWEPDLWAIPPYTTDEDYIEGYRTLFTNSVRRMSRTHKPLACEVSGGLDSSAVFCMAEHLRRSGKLPAPAVEGYTLAFTDDSAANELVYARAAGEHVGKLVHEVPPTLLSLDWYAENANTYREFPGYPNGSMSIDLRQQAASNGSRVVLTGEWGDALLQGSREYYAEEILQRHWRELYACLLTDVGAAGVPQAARWLLRSGAFPLLPDAFQQALRRAVRKLRGRGRNDTHYWISPSMQRTLEERRKRFGTPPPFVRTFTQRDLLSLLHNAFTAQVLERLERLGAQVGVEMRHPMGDPRLVQFAFSTPERLRLRGTRTKYLHVQALQDILPQSILDRRTKAEFSIVFRRHLDEMKEILTKTLPEQHPDWVVKDGMARLYAVYQNKPQFGLPSWVLWGIYGCDTMWRRPSKAIGKGS